MSKTVVVTREGYAGDSIKSVNPINPSVKTRSATEQPLYRKFIVNNDELLNKEERESIAEVEKVERGNQSPQEAFEYMNSGYNKVKENLLEQSKSRR